MIERKREELKRQQKPCEATIKTFKLDLYWNCFDGANAGTTGFCDLGEPAEHQQKIVPKHCHSISGDHLIGASVTVCTDTIQQYTNPHVDISYTGPSIQLSFTGIVELLLEFYFVKKKFFPSLSIVCAGIRYFAGRLSRGNLKSSVCFQFLVERH